MDETLEGVSCNLLGEVTHRGALVCEPHARLLGAEDRAVLLRGIVSTLDLCLKSLSVHRDVELLETLRFERAEAVQELDLAQEALRSAESCSRYS
ncbi:MAG: hypothetical protein WA982_00160 [Rubrobacteraceae bacterium]